MTLDSYAQIEHNSIPALCYVLSYCECESGLMHKQYLCVYKVCVHTS